MGEQLTTASGGNLVRCEVNRNERAVRGTVAKIEVADGSVNKYGLFTIVPRSKPGEAAFYGISPGSAAAGR